MFTISLTGRVYVASVMADEVDDGQFCSSHQHKRGSLPEIWYFNKDQLRKVADMLVGIAMGIRAIGDEIW